MADRLHPTEWDVPAYETAKAPEKGDRIRMLWAGQRSRLLTVTDVRKNLSGGYTVTTEPAEESADGLPDDHA